MTEVRPLLEKPRPDSMFLAGVEVPGELVEWLQWMVGGRTADVLSEALYIHSPLVLLSARDEDAILQAIRRSPELPNGLVELEHVLTARRKTRHGGG
jgi:hypothetical protein